MVRTKYVAAVMVVLSFCGLTNTANAVLALQWDPGTDPDEAAGMAVTFESAALGMTGGLLRSFGLPNGTGQNNTFRTQFWDNNNPAEYIEFTATGSMIYESVQISWFRGTSPDPNLVAIRSSVDTFAADIVTATHPGSGLQEITLDISSLGAQSGTLTFRLFFRGGDGSETAAVFIDGTGLGGNGLRVNGSAIPEPGGPVLLGLAGLGFFGMRRFRPL